MFSIDKKPDEDNSDTLSGVYLVKAFLNEGKSLLKLIWSIIVLLYLSDVALNDALSYIYYTLTCGDVERYVSDEMHLRIKPFPHTNPCLFATESRICSAPHDTPYNPFLRAQTKDRGSPK